MSTEDPNLYRTLGPTYISSIQPLLDNEDLQGKYKIKTIISITKSDIPTQYTTAPYKHLQISIDDIPNEVIIPYFAKVNKLISETIYKSQLGANGKPELTGDAVLVHCQSGVSRSVAFVCAYLMYRYKLPLSHALHAIRRNNTNDGERKHTFQPNDGFLEQLEIYRESEFCDDTLMLRKISPRWRAYRMEYLITNMIHQTNHSGKLDDGQFSNLSIPTQGSDENWFGFKCAKCRTLLASSDVYIPHAPPFDKNDKQMYFVKSAFRGKRVINRQLGQNECTHIFTEPLLWMREKIVSGEEGGNDELEGRLDCYKCGTKVGGWNWKGGRCSCGKWMVPAIHLLKSRVVQTDRNNKLILTSDERAV